MKIWKLKSQCISLYYTKITKNFKKILQSDGKVAENETLYPDGEMVRLQNIIATLGNKSQFLKTAHMYLLFDMTFTP